MYPYGLVPFTILDVPDPTAKSPSKAHGRPELFNRREGIAAARMAEAAHARRAGPAPMRAMPPEGHALPGATPKRIRALRPLRPKSACGIRDVLCREAGSNARMATGELSWTTPRNALPPRRSSPSAAGCRWSVRPRAACICRRRRSGKRPSARHHTGPGEQVFRSKSTNRLRW